MGRVRVPMFKIGDRRNSREVLGMAEVSTDVRRFVPAERGCLLAGTSFALAKLPAELRFHFTLFDEAGQIPLAHSFPGMNVSRRWIFVGDHRQLPPVIQGDHVDPVVRRSVFEHLDSLHGSRMLTTTYRMNDAICSFVGDAFYGGALTAAPAVAARRMQAKPGGRCEDLLDPRKPLVVGVVEHEGRLMRSPEEAEVAASLVEELVQHHGKLRSEVAVISPFRAQNALIESLLRHRARLVEADTVDRMQGQEFDVVIISLTASDPEYLRKRADFLFSTNRLNVAISRARTKCIVLGSRSVFRGRSLDVEHLKAMSLFSRMYREWHRVEVAPALISPAAGG
jgi:DNA replication ATP-dependent helicase Dna2